MYSAACVDEMSLTDIALGSVFDGTSSTMRGGAVGPSSSCVHHAEVPGSARTARDTGRGERCGAEAGASGMLRRRAAGVVWARGVAPSLLWCCRLPRPRPSPSGRAPGEGGRGGAKVMRSGREGPAGPRGSAEGPGARSISAEAASRNPGRVRWGSERGALITDLRQVGVPLCRVQGVRQRGGSMSREGRG